MPCNRWLLSPIIWLSILSCQTGGDSTDQSDELASKTSEEPSSANNIGPVPAAECPGRAPICTKEYAPVICTFSVYAGRPLKASERLVTWGSNACVGTGRLYQEACKNLMQPRLIGQLQCVPDASGGRCPPHQTKCTQSLKPSICTANAYGKEQLSADQKIIAMESNECLARAKLKMDACRANLDPSLLTKVYCENVAKKKNESPQ